MIHALDHQLHHAVLDTFEATFGKRPSQEQIQIQTTRTEFEGDRTVVVFPLAGMAGAPPQVAADRLGKALVETFDWIVKYGVVKGFLNLTLSDESWSTAIQDALTDSWGFAPKNSKSQVMVEYSSPNQQAFAPWTLAEQLSWLQCSQNPRSGGARGGEGPNHQ